MDIISRLKAQDARNQFALTQFALTQFTRIKDMPEGGIWDAIRQLYRRREAAYRILGHILNGLATERKIAFTLSRRTLDNSFKSDRNFKRRGAMNEQEFDRFAARFIYGDGPVFLKIREHIYRANGRHEAAAFQLIDDIILKELEMVTGKIALEDQKKTFLALYDEKRNLWSGKRKLEKSPQQSPHISPQIGPQTGNRDIESVTVIETEHETEREPDSTGASAGLSAEAGTESISEKNTREELERLAELVRKYELCSDEILVNEEKNSVEFYEEAVNAMVTKYLETTSSPLQISSVRDALQGGELDIPEGGQEMFLKAYESALSGGVETEHPEAKEVPSSRTKALPTKEAQRRVKELLRRVDENKCRGEAQTVVPMQRAEKGEQRAATAEIEAPNPTLDEESRQSDAIDDLRRLIKSACIKEPGEPQARFHGTVELQAKYKSRGGTRQAWAEIMACLGGRGISTADIVEEVLGLPSIE